MLGIGTILISYILGCFNTGYYLVRFLTGQDIRTLHSGNSGSRNVGRLLGSRGFMLTLVGDAGKGMIAVWFARSCTADLIISFAALTAVTAGHIWPAQLHFRGGKGFATLSGGLILLAPELFLATTVLALLCLVVFRNTTKAGLLAVACSPILMTIMPSLSSGFRVSAELILYCTVVAIVLYAHRSNIRQGGMPSLTNAD